MDRDPRENAVDPVEDTTSPATGPTSDGDDTNRADGQSDAKRHDRQERGKQAKPPKRSEPAALEPQSDQPPVPLEDSNPGNPRPAER